MFKSLNEEELIVSRVTRVSLSNQTWWAYISHNRAMHKDFYKTNANLDHKKCVLRLEAGDWEVCFQLLAEENSVNIKQLWVKKWCTKGKNRISLGQESKGLDCSIKIWERLWTNALGNLIRTYYLKLFL